MAFFLRRQDTKLIELSVGQFNNSPRRVALFLASPGLVSTHGHKAVPLCDIPRLNKPVIYFVSYAHNLSMNIYHHQSRLLQLIK